MRPHNGESSYGKSTLSRAVHPHYPIIRKTPLPGDWSPEICFALGQTQSYWKFSSLLLKGGVIHPKIDGNSGEL